MKTNYISLITFGIFVLIIKFLIDYFLFTDLGLAIRATGDNPVMIESLGVNTDNIKILGLFIANGLAGLSGALVAQYNGFSDIGMGSGMIITGLASVIIGEVIIRTRRIPLATLGVIVGSIVYRLARAITYELDFVEPTDLKLVSVIIIIIALGAPTLRKFMIQDEFAENLLEEGGTDA
ncbi:MAG: ABC transporter permease [Bacillota bacterium]